MEEELKKMYLRGDRAKEAIAIVAGETGLPRKELYQAWLRMDRGWENEKETR